MAILGFALNPDTAWEYCDSIGDRQYETDEACIEMLHSANWKSKNFVARLTDEFHSRIFMPCRNHVVKNGEVFIAEKLTALFLIRYGHRTSRPRALTDDEALALMGKAWVPLDAAIEVWNVRPDAGGFDIVHSLRDGVSCHHIEHRLGLWVPLHFDTFGEAKAALGAMIEHGSVACDGSIEIAGQRVELIAPLVAEGLFRYPLGAEFDDVQLSSSDIGEAGGWGYKRSIPEMLLAELHLSPSFVTSDVIQSAVEILTTWNRRTLAMARNCSPHDGDVRLALDAATGSAIASRIGIEGYSAKGGQGLNNLEIIRDILDAHPDVVASIDPDETSPQAQVSPYIVASLIGRGMDVTEAFLKGVECRVFEIAMRTMARRVQAAFEYRAPVTSNRSVNGLKFAFPRTAGRPGFHVVHDEMGYYAPSPRALLDYLPDWEVERGFASREQAQGVAA
jgi:hypothetical protein